MRRTSQPGIVRIIRPVLRSAKKIATLLLAVFLTTVLTPSFGWETAVAQSAHGHHDGGTDETFGAMDSPVVDAHPGIGSDHHHGCAGHMFGHLVAYVGDEATLRMPDLREAMPPVYLAESPVGFADRIDRPPRSLLL